MAEPFAPQLSADGQCATHWNWTYIDPITEALMSAVGDHPIVLGFATSPEWIWTGGQSVQVPPVNQRFTGYEQGRQLRDASFQEIVDYYYRLASHYTVGSTICSLYAQTASA